MRCCAFVLNTLADKVDTMAAQETLVSVVIPTYNQAHFLKEALGCIVQQSWQHWEVIVINNFSTDGTTAVVSSFSDARIRCIDFRNQGVIAASRNLGIKESKGDFVAFLDSDDTWELRKLELCVNKLNEGYDLVCHGEYHFVDGSPRRRPVNYGPVERTRYARLLAKGNCLSTSAIVVRRELLEKIEAFDIDPQINTAEDYDLWLRISARGAKIAIIDDMLGSYRIHPRSASASVVKNAKATLAVVLRHMASLHGHASILQRVLIWTFVLRIRMFILRRSKK